MLNLDMKLNPSDFSEQYGEVLSNWKALNAKLTELSADEIKSMIVYELKTKRRLTMLDRLCTRYSKLESRANQAEMMRAYSTADTISDELG